MVRVTSFGFSGLGDVEGCVCLEPLLLVPPMMVHGMLKN